jgi:dTDP-4-amino-4,6-dideoxygalactose transaminase
MSHAELPALLGGAALCPNGAPPWPVPDEDVLQALRAAYQDGSWGKYHGGNVERLEAALARRHGVDFALSCSSGTIAVEMALRALKVGSDDEVLLAAYDYSGNFLSVHAVGARPVLADVSPGNWQIDWQRIEAAIGPTTRAIVASHLHGGIVDMRAVMEIAGRHGLGVVEDAAQAPGAAVQGRPAGTWGDIGILSFGGSKLLTAGRGGAVLTRRADLHQRMRLLMHRGNHVCPLSELQAAVLLPQLDKLDDRNATRARAVRILAEKLKSLAGLRLFENGVDASDPGYYKVGFQYDPEAFGLSRERFLAAVQSEGVALDEGFKALHIGRSPNRFRASGELTEARRAHAGTVVLHHPVLLRDDSEIELVAASIDKIYASRRELAAGFPV